MVALAAALIMLCSLTVLGAITLRLANLGGGMGLLLALVVGGTFAVALPLLLDRSVTSAYRKLENQAASTWKQTAIGWNLLLLVFAMGAAPKTTRVALETHGAWYLGGSANTGVGRSVHWLARHIPRSEATATREQSAVPASAQPKVAESVAPPPPAPAPSIPDQAQTPEQVFNLRVASVVVIAGRQPIPESSPVGSFFEEFGIRSMPTGGSGFVVSDDGLVVTNYHVIEDASTLQVALNDGRKFDDVTIEVADHKRDLALLRVDAKGLPRAPLSDADKIMPGSRAIAIGSPLGLDFSLTDGIVSGTRVIANTTFLQMQTAIAPGSSGGPLLDARGRVIGVNTATKGSGMNLAVFVKHVRDLLAAPRSPQRLPRHQQQARVSQLTIEGSEASPVELMQTEEWLSFIALSAEPCVKQTLEKPEVTVRFLLDKRGFMSGDPALTSNFPEPDMACLRKGLGKFGRLLAMVLAQTYPAKVRKGGPVTLQFQLDGLPLSAEVKAQRPIVVRIALGSD